MGFKDLFIKAEEPNVQPASQQVTQPAVQAAPAPVVSGIPIQMPQTSAIPVEIGVDESQVNPEIVSMIWDKIIEKNLPGPDYIEFKNTAAGLIDVIPTEELQLKGAFNVLKRSYPNFTKDIIASSIDTYIGIVNEEKQLGMNECNVKRQLNVGDKQDKIKAYYTTLEEIQKQISELEAKKAEVATQIQVLSDEVNTATANIEREEKIFINSVNSVIGTLQSDKNKVSLMNI